MYRAADRRKPREVVGALAIAVAMIVGLAACTSTGPTSPDSSEASSADGSADSTLASGVAAQAEGSYAPPTMATEVSIPPAATTPVPAPGGGDINETVAAVPVTTHPAAQITDTVDLGSSVEVQVQDVAAVTGTARGLGEIGGPSAAVTVKITNNSSEAIPLGQVQVTAEDSSGTPASPVSGDPAVPMSGELQPGESATGVFVFYLGETHQNPLKISISYSAGAPVALYTADI